MTTWRNTIEKSLIYIEDNITEKITLLDLANHIGYSPFYFSRLFRSVVGITVKKYIAERRLCRAAFDIRDTHERLIDIAIKYGFSSQEVLTRAIKNSYGCTPNVFRSNPYLISLPSNMFVSDLENIKERRGLSMNEYLEKGKEILAEHTKSTGFTHKFVGTNIVSSDPKRLADFYEKVLGAYIVNNKIGRAHV